MPLMENYITEQLKITKDKYSDLLDTLFDKIGYVVLTWTKEEMLEEMQKLL